MYRNEEILNLLDSSKMKGIHMNQLILASGSPRRREIMEQVGLEFQVMVSKKEEVITKETPQEAVQELATQKAQDIANDLNGDGYIIGADTVVVQNGSILGKPKDKEDGIQMLSRLSGQNHSVYTGVCILYKKADCIVDKICFYEETKVTMVSMSEEEIKEYVETGEPMDKAGAYGIQGKAAAFIKKIDGDYYNVVGLPISRLVRELRGMGYGE